MNHFNDFIKYVDYSVSDYNFRVATILWAKNYCEIENHLSLDYSYYY